MKKPAFIAAVAVAAGTIVALLWLRPTAVTPLAPLAPDRPAAAPSTAGQAASKPSPAAPTTHSGSPGANLAASLRALAAEVNNRADEFIATMSVAEIELALNHVWNQDGNRDLPHLLLRRWTEESPTDAAAWLLKQPPGPNRRDGTATLATVWANVDSAAATAWARQLPAEEMESSVLAIGHELARSSPKDALWLAAALPSNESRNGLIDHAISQWAVQEPEAPADWAAQIPASPLRDQVFARLATSMSETDPIAAADLALEHLAPGPQQNDAIVGVVQRWTQRAPSEAAEWVRQFPEGELQATAIENVLQLWAGQDPSGAGNWLNDLDPSPLRDAALSAYAGQLAASDARGALDWAAKIEDQARRAGELERLGARWIASDRAAARSWVQTAPLPDDARQRLLAIPELRREE